MGELLLDLIQIICFLLFSHNAFCFYLPGVALEDFQKCDNYSCSRLETSIPCKHGPTIAGYDKALNKFFDNVLQSVRVYIAAPIPGKKGKDKQTDELGHC